MIYIAHRGNVFGANETKENDPRYIEEALSFGFHVEIDIRIQDDAFYLGHDVPQYSIDLSWIESRKNRLWIHCKDLYSLSFFNRFLWDYNYFWHETDKATLTSKGYIWAYPGMQPIKNSIAVMPELHKEDIKSCVGICSDYVHNYMGGLI
jgi:hypothetical protein